jgi:hypothetical protein
MTLKIMFFIFIHAPIQTHTAAGTAAVADEEKAPEAFS